MMMRRKLPDVKLPFSETKHTTMNSTSVDSHLGFVLIPLQALYLIIVIVMFVTLLSINQLHHRKCLTRIFTFTPVTSRTSLKEKLLQNDLGFQTTINFLLARIFINMVVCSQCVHQLPKIHSDYPVYKSSPKANI